MRMNTTLVINPKGGSGKTTVTTNLASHFAAGGVSTTVMDYDPQGSSLNWLRLREPHAPKIHAANGAPARPGQLRSIAMHVPPGTRQLVIDAPAGASGLLLQELLSRADCIIIPVAPSAIDIHATANFIRDLLLSGRLRARNIRLAVVANRVRSSMPVYQPLERFLNSLSLPLLTRLSDSDLFLKAAETGVGIFEMDPLVAAAERDQFLPIVNWVDPQAAARPAAPRVIELPRVAAAQARSAISVPAWLRRTS
jgi:chromosome partitioning protein